MCGTVVRVGDIHVIAKHLCSFDSIEALVRIMMKNLEHGRAMESMT